MLKIYLDWNIITHLKSDGDDNKEILDALQEYKRFFVFPYSIAHLHDLYSGDRWIVGQCSCPHDQRMGARITDDRLKICLK